MNPAFAPRFHDHAVISGNFLLGATGRRIPRMHPVSPAKNAAHFSKAAKTTMPTSTNYIHVAFWTLALAASLFHGLSATSVFEVSTAGKRWPWRPHQFWLNFCGSVAGWVALWFLARRAIECAVESCSAQFGWEYVGLFFLAFLGVTGYVPFTVVGLAAGVRELAAKATSLVK